jgi:hypothetical protein
MRPVLCPEDHSNSIDDNLIMAHFERPLNSTGLVGPTMETNVDMIHVCREVRVDGGEVSASEVEHDSIGPSVMLEALDHSQSRTEVLGDNSWQRGCQDGTIIPTYLHANSLGSPAESMLAAPKRARKVEVCKAMSAVGLASNEMHNKESSEQTPLEKLIYASSSCPSSHSAHEDDVASIQRASKAACSARTSVFSLTTPRSTQRNQDWHSSGSPSRQAGSHLHNSAHKHRIEASAIPDDGLTPEAFTAQPNTMGTDSVHGQPGWSGPSDCNLHECASIGHTNKALLSPMQPPAADSDLHDDSRVEVIPHLSAVRNSQGSYEGKERCRAQVPDNYRVEVDRAPMEDATQGHTDTSGATRGPSVQCKGVGTERFDAKHGICGRAEVQLVRPSNENKQDMLQMSHVEVGNGERSSPVTNAEEAFTCGLPDFLKSGTHACERLDSAKPPVQAAGAPRLRSLAASSLKQVQEVLSKALLVHDVAADATENAVGLLQHWQFEPEQQETGKDPVGALAFFCISSYGTEHVT